MDFSKRKHPDSNDAVSKKRSGVVFVNDPPTYSSSEGLKSSVHGTVYQLNLSVLFLQRGLNNQYLFRLAVEMDAAEKFDDLVFQYVKKDAAGRDLIAEDGEPVYVYRFLQAKHKQDEGKTISYHDLCTADRKGEFSLPKYFTSYRAIKRKAEFKRGEVRDYILCTNINLDFDQLEEKKIDIEEITEADDFLTMRGTNYRGNKKSARCYKVRPVNSAAHELYDILKNTSDLHRLAKELVKHIKLRKSADLINASFKSYHAALVEENVMRIEKKLEGKFIGKFNETFLNCSSTDGDGSSSSVGTGLSERAIKLREIMKEYEEQSKVSIDGDTELNVSSTFGQTFQLDVDPQLTDWKKFVEEFVSLLQAAGTDTVTIERRKPIIKENINKLAGHVFVESAAADQQLVQFSSAFLDPTTQLPGNLTTFRDELMKSMSTNTSTTTTTTLAQFRFKINKFFTCADGELHTRAQLPHDFIKDEEIADFFDKLVFAVNQPNEAELSEIITAEIGEDFNLIDSDFVASYVQKIMLDWFKEKGRAKGAEGRFFTYEDGVQLFALTRQKVARLILVSSKLEYEAKMETLGVTFKAHVVEKLTLSDFLTSKNCSAQVFRLATDYPTLSAIKLYQSLKCLNEYQKDDSYIFKRLSLLWRMRQHVLRGFESKDCNLLIIECARADDNTIKDNKDIESLGEELRTIINFSNSKKIVLICKPTDYALSDQLRVSTEIADNLHLSLPDLTDESRIQLLKQSKMVLHEREIVTSDLIDESASDLVDSATLIKLINEEVINLGNDLKAFSSAGYDSNYYIERTFNRHLEIKPSIFQKKKNVDLFAISGVNEIKLSRLGVESEKVCLFAEVEPNKHNNFTHRVIILDDDDGKAGEQFQELRGWFTSRNIHWLRSEKLIWQQSHGSISTLVHYKKMKTSMQRTISVYSEENVLLHEEKDGHKVVIISDTAGMGKSTVLVNFLKTIPTLFSAANDDQRPFWVIRIDLNNYTSELAKEVKAASFNKEDLELLIHFFIETLLDSQEQSKVKSRFEKRLIAHSLRKPSSKIKLVLLFDGFDEISPDYKDVVINLLRGLTHVAYIHKLFITTRPNFREALEEKLCVFAYTLESFSETNQVDFLVKFWKKKLVLTEENDDKAVLEFAKLVINKFSTAINDKDKEFTGIPLQLRMIAEVFQETPRNHDSTLSISWPGCKEFVDTYNNNKSDRTKLELPDKIDLLSLYEDFVRKKFYDLHYEEKKNVDFNKPGMRSSFEKSNYAAFIKGHQILAAHSLLSPVHFNEITSEIEIKLVLIDWIEDIRNGNENTGIIDKIINEKARFIHLTFAEYFVSFFFVQKLLFAESHFPITIRCINSIIANTSPLFLNNMIKLLDTEERTAKLSALLIGRTLVNAITEQGCLQFVKALLEAGYEDYPTADHLGRTPLHCAAIHSHPDIVSYLLKNDIKDEEGNAFLKRGSYLKKVDSQLVKYVNKEDNDRNTAVYYAAKNGSVEFHCDIAEYYAAQRVNEEMERDIAEYRAAKRVNMGIVRALLSRGANIVELKDYLKPVIQYVTNEMTSTFGDDAELQSIVETFLLQAPHVVLGCVEKYLYPKLLLPFIKRGRVDVVSALFSLLPDDDVATKKSILSGKILAATPLDYVNCSDELNDEDRLRITKFLVENGSTVTTLGVDSVISNCVTNILEAAATHGHLLTFQDFIDQESDENFHKHFYSAATYQRMNIIQYLLENYRKKVKDDEGNGALHMAVDAGASLTIVKYLLDNGEKENINAQNDKGETVLTTAIGANHKVKVIQFLVGNGADVNIADNLGKTALHYAVEKDELDIITYLLSLVTLRSSERLKFSSYLEKSSVDKLNAGLDLHVAIHCRDFERSRFLLRRGADVNTKDEVGKTPLHRAAEQQQTKIVELLLQYSAVYDERDENNQTPLDVMLPPDSSEEEELDLGLIIPLDWRWPLELSEILLKSREVNNQTQLDILESLEPNSSEEEADSQTPLDVMLPPDSSEREVNNQTQLDILEPNSSEEEVDSQTPLDVMLPPDSSERDANNQTQLEMSEPNSSEREVNNQTPLDVVLQPDLLDANNNKIIWLMNAINKFFNSQDLMGDFKETLLMNRDTFPVSWGAYHYGLGLPDVLLEHNPILFILNARNADGMYLLHVAAENNDFPAFQFLFQWNDDFLKVQAELPQLLSRTMNYHAISVDAVDFRGNTPLHLAAKNGHQLLTSNLLEKGAIFDSKNHAGQTPASLANNAGHDAITKMLLPNQILFEAFEKDDLEEVRKCMAGAAYLNAKDSRSGKTALHFAAASGHVDIARYLLKYEALVDAIDAHGQTPLHLAIINNKIEIVKLLLRYRANVNVVDQRGNALECGENNRSGNLVRAVNELFSVIQSHNPQRIIDDLNCLTEVYGIDVSDIINARDSRGNSLLLYAVEGNYVKISEFLLENGAIYDVIGKWRNAVKRNVEITKDVILLIDGMFLNVTSIVETASIMSARIITNVRNLSGRTLLHEAALYGSLKVVKWLVEHGANVLAEDFGGKTALQLVTEADKDMYKEIIVYLKLRSGT